MFSSNTSSAASDANYVEDVFSTYLYTGNGSTQTITNGIDLSGKGGLVWLKSRGIVQTHGLIDTVRGATKLLRSNITDAEITSAASLTSFNVDGFSIGSTFNSNTAPATYVSWTFREQPKFFDIVTYTGTGSNTTIAHNLGSVPGFIIVKRTDAAADWQCYHRSLANTQYMVLNDTAAVATGATRWNSTTPTSSVFSLGTDTTVNASGGTYAAYIYAHDAGGFGLTGTDNVISCGSYTGNGSATGPVVTLGYEPQWILTKRSNDTSGWVLFDNMRGIVTGGIDPTLFANSSAAEDLTNDYISLLATGFQPTASSSAINASGSTYIYIAIRRGPMKVPELGTEVFAADFGNNSATIPAFDASFPVDMAIERRPDDTTSTDIGSRLTGGRVLLTNATDAEIDDSNFVFDSNVGWGTNYATNKFSWMFKRAPGFFDVVCYTGTGVTNRTVTHNLTTAPQLLFVKSRSNVQAWSALCTLNSGLQGNLNTTGALSSPSAAVWGNGSSYVAPTSSVFTVGTDNETNASGWTYVAYLFATCSGVSKVGSYTGTAAAQTINCGFTAGSRFVMIKRTDSTGDWYVWDSARGIIAGDDPYLLLNSTAAEVTNTDYVDTAATGFELTSTAPAAINASGGTYIFLAIA